MKTRKFAALILAVLLLTTLFAGCTGTAPTATTAATTAAAATTTAATTAAATTAVTTTKAATSAATTVAVATTTAAPEQSAYNEAPKLAALVASGDLEPVDARLPENVITVNVHDDIGTYGETLYGAFPSGYAGQAYQTLGFYEPALGWNDDLSAMQPNIIEAWEQSADASSFILTIRKGLRWSNGDPVTTEDIRYVYEDVWQNTALSTAFPNNFMAGGEPCVINIIDEYTFEIVFTVPNPAFKYIMCQEGNTNTLFVPSAYMSQFNDRYVDAAKLTKLAKAENYDDWMKLYEFKNNYQKNVDRPTLYAWRMISISEDNLIRRFERNPYYFKTDSEGNQLPYLDYVQVEYVDNSETLKLKVMSGEVDYINAPIGEDFTQWPMLAENADAGNYRLILASADFNHKLLIMPNLASQDPQKGALLSDKNFRIALSQSINREEIISLLVTVADFQGIPSQQCPCAVSAFADEELANQYIEYDPDYANQLLDELGLTARGTDGYRLGPDGQPMTFQFTIPTYGDFWVDCGNLCAGYWQAIGLNVVVKAVAPDIWNELNNAGELEITALSSGSGGTMILDAKSVKAYSTMSAGWDQRWGTLWAKWNASNGAEGIEPPQIVKDMAAKGYEILAEGDEDKAAAKFQELLDLYGELFPTIGICTPLPSFCVCSNDLLNTPADYEPWVIFTYGVGGNVNPCQWYK